MAENIEHLQEQKVILQKAKSDVKEVLPHQQTVKKAKDPKTVKDTVLEDDPRNTGAVLDAKIQKEPEKKTSIRVVKRKKKKPVVKVVAHTSDSNSASADDAFKVRSSPMPLAVGSVKTAVSTPSLSQAVVSAPPTESKKNTQNTELPVEMRRTLKSVSRRGERGKNDKNQKKEQRDATIAVSVDPKTQVRSLDLSSKRPDRRAGNLAGGNKHSNRYAGQAGGQRRRPGFSGTQARANADGNGYRPRSNFGQNGQSSNPRQAGYGQDRQRTGGFGGRAFGFQSGQNRNASGRGGGPGVPMPLETNKQPPNKKTFKGKKPAYSRREQENDFFEEKLLHQKKKTKEKISAVPKEIEMLESISVAELARKMNLKASELIGKLMGMGMLVTMNQSIDADTATILASEYNCDVKIVSLYDETIIETVSDEHAELLTRPPIVTIMGHVDHGKTKTLDAIRSTNVIAQEFGGITQHIGAYMVETPKGKITFLDTPGHEAFTMMRARGAAITDIVVLVVAADDGVMPQTIEALNHAKDAHVPIIVAINKIDKPEANQEKIKTRLAELGLIPDDWGGDTMYVPISALKKQGIDDLLEAVLLQSDVLELKANHDCPAEGKVVESQVDHGRGIVATIIVQRGVLRTGDPYVAGVYSGRVRAIFNDKGVKINEATPSMPVEILGLEGMPNAGDPFHVTNSERIARQISSKRQELKRFENSRNVKKVTLDNLYETITDGEILELKVIIKGDVQGSVEALKQSLEKLSTAEVRLNVIHASAGAINDSDVMLAAADSNALIIGFNVRPTPQAKLLAEQEKVDIRKYNIIYKAVEEIELAMEGLLSPDLKETIIGTAEIRNVIKIPKIGNIAGCYVLTGIGKRNALVHLIRDGIVIHSGKINSLRRFKDDVKEVASGFECGIAIENYNDYLVGDQLEIIEMVEVARKLKDTKKLASQESLQGDGNE